MASSRIFRAVEEMTNLSKNYARSNDYPYMKKCNLIPLSHFTEKFRFGQIEDLTGKVNNEITKSNRLVVYS